MHFRFGLWLPTAMKTLFIKTRLDARVQWFHATEQKKKITKLLQNPPRLAAISVPWDEQCSFRLGLELIAPVVVHNRDLGGCAPLSGPASFNRAPRLTLAAASQDGGRLSQPSQRGDSPSPALIQPIISSLLSGRGRWDGEKGVKMSVKVNKSDAELWGVQIDWFIWKRIHKLWILL